MIDFSSAKIDIPKSQGDDCSNDFVFVFPPNSVVTRADVAIKGFELKFTGNDHHLYREMVKLTSFINGNTVKVVAKAGLRDKSGEYDDDYEGWVEVLVIVDRS
jgi:hypothetical protein